QLQTSPDVGVGRSIDATYEVTLAQYRRNVTCDRTIADSDRSYQHVRHTWMNWQRRHRAAMMRDGTGLIECAKHRQQLRSLLERRWWRSVEPTKLVNDPYAGNCKLENERREIGLKNLRTRVFQKMMLLVLGPQAVAPARRRSSGSSRALVGRRARYADSFETRHSASWRKPGCPRESAVDHDPDTLDRETRFRDRRREHDLARSPRCGCNRCILCLLRQIAIQRLDVHVLRHASPEQCGHTTYLRSAGKKYQNVPVVIIECSDDSGCNRRCQIPRVRPRRVRQLDWKDPPFASDHRRIIQKRCDPRAVQRGRHHEYSEIGSYQ